MGPQKGDTQIAIEFRQWNVRKTESNSQSPYSASAGKGVCVGKEEASEQLGRPSPSVRIYSRPDLES